MHLFVSQEYLNKRSIIPNNIDFTLLEPILEITQDLDIVPILGSDYYNELITQSTPPTSFTSENQTILDKYVIPAMVHFFMARASRIMNARFTNQGVVTNTGNHSTPLDKDTISELEDMHRNTGEVIIDRMKKYLNLKGQTVFPTYFSSNNQTLIPPSTEAFDSPIFLPEGKKVNPYPNWGDIK